MIEEKTNTFGLWYFFLQGVGSLVGWNAVLTSLDYFNDKYPAYQVNFIFPIVIFFANIIVSTNIVYMQQKISLNTRVAAALGLLGIILLLLPIEAALLEGTGVGFVIILIMLFFLGLSNTSQQASVSGMAGIFPFKYMNKFILGTGMAGLLISCLRIIILLVLGDQADTSSGQIVGILVYYGISAAFLIGNIVIHFKFVKTDFCKEVIEAHQKKTLLHESPERLNRTEVESASTSGPLKKSDNPYRKLWEGFLSIKMTVILMILIYAQTFMVFPGVTLDANVSFLDGTWSTVLIITTYNMFDSVGKSLTNYRQYYNLNSVAVLIVGRFIFFIPFILMAIGTNTPIIGTSWFPFVNIAFFAATNGYATSCLFILGPEQVIDVKKETAGFVCMFGLLFGISCGTFLALCFENLGS